MPLLLMWPQLFWMMLFAPFDPPPKQRKRADLED